MTSSSHVPRLLLLSLLATALPLGSARASHTTFSASVDRFEIDGNVFGTPDGTLDQVDEFDNGTISPEWSILLGTAVEADGILTVRDPGVDITLVPGVNLDVSNVENAVDVENGAGDFTATSYWVPTLPGIDRNFHFQLYGLGSAIEAAGLTMNNSSPALAAAQGTPAGYSISQEVTFPAGGGQPDQATVAFTAAQVTGPIVLRLAFDDANDLLTCSFSLDGGTTFQSPFPPLHIFQAVSEHEILLGAASVEAQNPGGCVPIRKAAVGMRRLNLPNGERTLRLKGKLPFSPGVPVDFDPAAHGAGIVITDTTSAEVFSLTIPGGGPGTGCAPQDGWQRTGTSFLYRNFSNAIPPGCAPGSALGLDRLKLQDGRARRGEILVGATAQNATVANSFGGVRLKILLADQPDAACGQEALACRHAGGAAACNGP